jgi:hypothetical protein
MLAFKIARHMFIFHTHNQANCSWIKVHENSFTRIVIKGTNACIEAVQTLFRKLKMQFPNHEIMMAFGLVYP